MDNQIRAAEIFVDKVRRDYPEDVAIVAVMGSHLYGETHARSDLDLYFIPKTERARSLSKVCIVDGIGFDFWPISWERMERIASHEERITSILTEGRILNHGSKEDLSRFSALKERALDRSDGVAYLALARKRLEPAYRRAFWMARAEDRHNIRMDALAILQSAASALAALNRDTVKRGRGRLLGEILAMPLVPADFADDYRFVMSCPGPDAARAACARLVAGVALLVEAEAARSRPARTFRERLQDLYEEAINCYNKILHACEVHDPATALFAATELQAELDEAFAGTGEDPRDLPPLVALFDPLDLEAFPALALAHQKAFLGLLERHGVKICAFKDFGELERYFDKL